MASKKKNEAKHTSNPKQTNESDQNRPSAPSSTPPLEGPPANDDRELASRHIEHLKKSGLTDETIAALGFDTVDTGAARKVLGWPDDKKGDPAGLLIPYPNVPGYAKVRPDSPRVVGPEEKKSRSFTDHNYAEQPPETDGRKVIKYEAPLGSELHCYIAFAICPALTDTEQRLYITEGEKKAALMCQEGEPCISIPGVSSGHDVEHRRAAQDFGGKEFVLHPDLEGYVVPGREVCILFDSPDMTENLHVIRGAVRLAKMINTAEAEALLGYVPTVKGAEKTGVDDYFVDQKRRREFNKSKSKISPLTADFADARPVGPNAVIKWLADEKAERGWTKDELHAELRRAVIWARVWHEQEQKLFNDWCRSASNQFFVSIEGLKAMADHLPVVTKKTKEKAGYAALTDDDLVEHCVPVLNAKFALLRGADGTERLFTFNERREVTLVLKDGPLVQTIHDALKEKFNAVPPQNLLDRAIDLWKRECPKLATEPAPFCFKGDALTFKRFDWEPGPGSFSAWEEFLSRLSDRDAFMAYVWSCFEPKNVSRQYLWLRGNGQDGKSRVLSTLVEVFGPAATGITGIQMQAKQFLYSAIYGKRVVVYADCKNPKFGMGEFVRNATSGDPVMIEFKNQTPFSWQMRIKLFVASNPKPEITGQTADASRMI